MIKWEKKTDGMVLPSALSSLFENLVSLTKEAVNASKTANAILKKVKWFFADDIDAIGIALLFVINESIEILKRFRKTTIFFSVVIPGQQESRSYWDLDYIETENRSASEIIHDTFSSKAVTVEEIDKKQPFFSTKISFKEYGILANIFEINALKLALRKIDNGVPKPTSILNGLTAEEVLEAYDSGDVNDAQKEYILYGDGIDKTRDRISSISGTLSTLLIKMKKDGTLNNRDSDDYKTSDLYRKEIANLRSFLSTLLQRKATLEKELKKLLAQDNNYFWTMSSKQMGDYIYDSLSEQKLFTNKDVLGGIFFIAAFGGKSIKPLLKNASNVAKLLGKLLDIGPFLDLKDELDDLLEKAENKKKTKTLTQEELLESFKIGRTFVASLPSVITKPIRNAENFLIGMRDSIVQGTEAIDEIITLIDVKIEEIDKLTKALESINDLVKGLKEGIDPTKKYDDEKWTQNVYYTAGSIIIDNDYLFMVSALPEDVSKQKSGSKKPDFSSIVNTSNEIDDNGIKWRYLYEYTNTGLYKVTAEDTEIAKFEWSPNTLYPSGYKLMIYDKYIIEVTNPNNVLSGEREPEFENFFPETLTSEEYDLFDRVVLDNGSKWRLIKEYEELPTPESQGGLFMLTVPPQLGGLEVIKQKMTDETDSLNPYIQEYFYTVSASMIGGGIGIALLMMLFDSSSMSFSEALGYSDEDLSKIDDTRTELIGTLQTSPENEG